MSVLSRGWLYRDGPPRFVDWKAIHEPTAKASADSGATPQARLGRLEAPEHDLTRSVLLRSQPITAGDSTSDREVRDATAGESPAQAVSGAGPEIVNTQTFCGASGSAGCRTTPHTDERAGGEAGSSVSPRAQAPTKKKTPDRL